MEEDKEQKEEIIIKLELEPHRSWWTVDETDKRWFKILLLILGAPFLILAILIIAGL